MSSEQATESPLNVADLQAVMRRIDAAGMTVGVEGSGTKRPPVAVAAPDVRVCTGRMDRVVEHSAGDLVVTAQAGVPLAALQAHVAPAGQWLGLDPPEPGATVGGVVAAAASGPRRLRYGTPRDLLIGITIVLADGTVARSGGKVVKNVAGYDLGKLFTGSFGSLGVIAECTFRLHPLPPARRVVTVSADDPVDAAARLHATGATPVAVEWDGGVVTAVFESIEPAVEAQAAATVAAIGGDIAAELPPDFGAHPWTGDPAAATGVKVTHRLGALREVVAAIRRSVPDPRLAAHVGSGVIRVATPEADLAWLDALREEVAAYDGSAVVAWSRGPVAADVWGPVRGLEVMRRIKERFDPDRRMSPGAFVGGL